jgi:hypothetical protein
MPPWRKAAVDAMNVIAMDVCVARPGRNGDCAVALIITAPCGEAFRLHAGHGKQFAECGVPALGP